MKKSILLGALAIFAISAMSIQSVEAQNPVKKQNVKTEVKKSQNSTDAATPTVTVKSDKATVDKTADTKQAASHDCCASDNKCKKQLSTARQANKKANSNVKAEVKKSKEKAVEVNKTDN